MKSQTADVLRRAQRSAQHPKNLGRTRSRPHVEVSASPPAYLTLLTSSYQTQRKVSIFPVFGTSLSHVFSAVEVDTSMDLVETHRRQNRANQPPDPERLRAAKKTQNAIPKPVTATQDSSEEESSSPTRVGTIMKSADTKEKFYPADYQRAMKLGGFLFKHLVTHVLFPDPKKVRPIGGRILLRSMKQVEKDALYPLDWTLYNKHVDGMTTYVRSDTFWDAGLNLTLHSGLGHWCKFPKPGQGRCSSRRPQPLPNSSLAQVVLYTQRKAGQRAP